MLSSSNGRDEDMHLRIASSSVFWPSTIMSARLTIDEHDAFLEVMALLKGVQ